MGDLLFQYHAVEPTTWVYLSSLLMIGLFFKFGRLWSVRNVDLILLILLAPGLLMVYYGQLQEGPGGSGGPDVGSNDVNRELDTRGEGGRSVVATESDAAAPNATGTATPDTATPDTASPDTASPGEATAYAKGDTESGIPNGVPTTSAEAGVRATGSDGDEGARGDSSDTVLVAAETRKAQSWKDLEILGFVYLIGVGGLWLTRLLLDPLMVRRPLLEPNLSLGGLAFIGCSLCVFLGANVIVEPTVPRSTDSTKDYRITRVAPASTQGPGYELLSWLPSGLSKSFCLVGQIAIVVGMGLIGYWHFRNLVMGIGAATLYLMLPYTSLLTGRVEHVLPAATLIWAVLTYRRPLLAGAWLGLASGLVYYPFFLLPLWISFYWHRGLGRFVAAYVATITVLALLLMWSPNGDIVADLQRMFGLYPPAIDNLGGIWDTSAGGVDGNYRLPVLVGFIALSASMALWPAQKNLGTLLSCSAAMMVAAQFWHGYGGGTYMAWYLPLALLTVFRPNLEDRVAVTVLADSWLPRRISRLPDAA